jgi:hypothetical protein
MSFLTEKQLSQCLEWLLANGSPPVQYLTLRHLLKADPESAKMRAAWRQVLKSPDAEEILSKQRPDGSWYDGGSWAFGPRYMPKTGYSPFTPKYVTAVWVLSLLGDMGFTIAQAPIRRAVHYILSFLNPNGLFSRFRNDNVHQVTGADNWPCDQGVYLTALGKVGMGGDPRLDASYDLLVRWQREDGGWVTQKHKVERNWCRSCPASTGGVVSAFYFSGRDSLREPLLRGLEFQVWHWAQKPQDEIRRFFYHGHNTLRELLMLVELNTHTEKRSVRQLLEWLASMYQEKEHCFRCPQPTTQGLSAQVAKYRLYHLTDPDWLSYYAARIAAALLPG